MKFLNFNKVLCLSPHPDDVEYGMLGTILKHKDTEFQILNVSRGGDFDESSTIKRHEECKLIWNEVDNLKGNFTKFVHIKDHCEDELINHIETDYDTDYECILVPPSLDSHFEHRVVNQLAFPLVRRSKCGIISYRTVSSLEKWIPNLFIDIEKEYDTKKRLLNYFKSQNNKSFFNKGPLDSFHKNYQCSKRGIEFVESFEVLKIYN